MLRLSAETYNNEQVGNVFR